VEAVGANGEPALLPLCCERSSTELRDFRAAKTLHKISLHTGVTKQALLLPTLPFPLSVLVLGSAGMGLIIREAGWADPNLP